MESKLQRQLPKAAPAHKPNLTGIPTQMKLDFERRSGLSFDDVRVHYNSDKPAQLRALAYTQGTQVYVGPGQERYLKHELGHVIQQKMGIVRPTKTQNGISINDSPDLEQMANQIAILPSTMQIYSKNCNGQIVTQCASDFNVMVSLAPEEMTKKKFWKNQLIVDTISIVGRTKTGLFGMDNKETQGDHIIADVLVKRAQKSNVKGKTVENLLNYYWDRLNKVISDVNYSWIEVSKGTKKGESTTSIPKKRRLKLVQEERKLLQQFEIPERLMKPKANTVLDVFGYPSSTIPRFQKAFDWATAAKEHINTIWSRKYAISEWNIALEQIIKAYNIAYAHSPFSTQDSQISTPASRRKGHGEAGAIHKANRNKYSVLKKLQEARLNRLIDMDSYSAITNHRWDWYDAKSVHKMISFVYPGLEKTDRIAILIANIKKKIENNIKKYGNQAEIKMSVTVYDFIESLYNVLTVNNDITKRRHTARLKHTLGQYNVGLSIKEKNRLDEALKLKIIKNIPRSNLLSNTQG